MSSTVSRERIPAYKRIQEIILQRIDSGEFKVGDLVYSERELAQMHEVSLMTARHALADLEREGIVERRRGAGTFVAPPKINFNKLTSYTEQMTGRNLPISSTILAFKIVQNQHEVAVHLSLPFDARLLKVERVREAGSEPFALETCYLPSDEFPGLRREALKRGSLFALLEHDFGLDIANSDEDIDATSADAEVARLLAVPRNAALLRIRQVIYSKQGKPSIYVIGLYRGDRHTLHVRRFR